MSGAAGELTHLGEVPVVQLCKREDPGPDPFTLISGSEPPDQQADPSLTGRRPDPCLKISWRMVDKDTPC